MTRRHDERWALPIGNDEYVHHLEEEFFRLRQAERTLEANIDFMRSERDRLKQASDELVRDLNEARSERARLVEALGRIADPEAYDLDARAMRRDAQEALGAEVIPLRARRKP